MSLARTATAEQRDAIFAALTRRNRLVGVLRIGIPLIGAIILAGLVLQLYLGSLVPDFGFANISVDRDNLVVDTPSYSGVGADGTVYRVEAASARAAFGNTDLIHMNGARFSMIQPGGTAFHADADTAQLQISAQRIGVTGETRISGDSGVAGTIIDARIDIDAQNLSSDGPADFVFSNGTTLRADTMAFSGSTQVWTFSGVTLDFPATPGEQAQGPRPGAERAVEDAAQ